MSLFKRHKILLGLLLETPRIPARRELMTWLFLLRHETCLSSDPSFYDFVPSNHWPFSFTACCDLRKLARLGYLNGHGYALHRPRVLPAREAFRTLPTSHRDAVMRVLVDYGELPEEQLRDTIRECYPWLASISRPAQAPVRASRARPAAYTAGYEGKSIDLFLQNLLRAGIEQLVDVRNNPISRKYGFSKTTLSRLCNTVGIDYVHIPELGIPPSRRRSLDSFEEYQELMSTYERSILPIVPEARHRAAMLIEERPSALVCFEADWRCCHRSRLAARISRETNLEVVHL